MAKNYKFTVGISWYSGAEFEVEAESEEAAIKQAEDEAESYMGGDANPDSLKIEVELSPGQDISEEDEELIFGTEDEHSDGDVDNNGDD